MKPRRILITGGAGYIGSWLVKSAVDAGFSPIVLDQALPGDGPLRALWLAGKIDYHQGSILNTDLLSGICGAVEAVIHLAAVSDGRAGKADPGQTQRVNAGSMERLLEICRASGVQRFLFASTFGVYGNQYREPLRESMPPKPVDPYSESKLAGEMLVSRAHLETFATASLRIAMVYGLGLKVREDFLLNALCRKAVSDGVLKISGGEQRRPQIHVKDVGRLFLTLLDADPAKLNGESFNAVEANPSVLELAELVRQSCPETVLERLPGRNGEDSFEVDGSKLTATFGFRPEHTLGEGIHELIQLYKTCKPYDELDPGRAHIQA